MALGRSSFGARGGTQKQLNTRRKLIFSNFLIIFEVALFNVKI